MRLSGLLALYFDTGGPPPPTPGLPVLSVKVAFGSPPYPSGPPVWTEIGPASGLGPGELGWARKITTKRGRERLLRSQSQFQAGTLSAELDNRDRRFDPTNAAGPYWPNVQPEKLIQVGATWAGTFYPVWTGYVDDWPQVWPGFEEANVPLVATDFFKAAALARLLSAGYQQAVLADGPAAYWRLGDPPGSTIALDTSGNHHNGVPNAAVTFGQTGAMPANNGTAALLPASGAGEIDFANGVFSGATSGLTIECWIKKAPMTTAGLLGLVTVNSATDTFLLRLNGTGASVPGSPNYGEVQFGYNLIGPTTVADGSWHHLVIVAAGGPGRLYVDGVLVASASPLSASAYPGIGSIGSAVLNGIVANTEDVEMQEVAIYGYPLTAAQVLNHFQRGAWPSEKTGLVVNRILDAVGFPAAQRSVDTGRTTCQADTQNETQTKVLDQLQKLEQTEQGQCFVSAGGNLTFQDRYHRYESPNANPVAILGDGGPAYPSEIPYIIGGVTLNFDRMELFNDIPVTRRGGTLQEVTNQASVNEYTNRTIPGLSDLLMATDADALYCAQWVLADTAWPQYRVGRLILNPFTNPALWPIVLGCDIGAVVTVVKHNIPGGGAPISLNCRVEGIEHEIDAPRSWITTWHVSLAGTLPWLILDDPVMDKLDVGNRWGW